MTASRTPVASGDLQRRLSAPLTDWQDLLERHPAAAREILGKLLDGRVIVTPRLIDGVRWFEFRGEATYGPLLHEIGSFGGVNDMVAPESLGRNSTLSFQGLIRAA